MDHMDYILSSMDMFASIAENLITFTFNVCFFAFGASGITNCNR